MVRSTLVTAWRLATSPTSASPDLANATTDGVVRPPSAFAITVGSPPSSTATTEFVVPRSMPTALAMVVVPSEVKVSALRSGWRTEVEVSTRPKLNLSALDSTSAPRFPFPPGPAFCFGRLAHRHKGSQAGGVDIGEWSLRDRKLRHGLGRVAVQKFCHPPFR